MKKIIKNIRVNENGELYCFSMDNKLKKRLVSAKEIKDIQKNGYETVPIIIEDRGVGVFKFKEEEVNTLMNMVKEQRKVNNQRRKEEDRNSEFRDKLVVESKNNSKDYKIYNEEQYSFGGYEER